MTDFQIMRRRETKLGLKTTCLGAYPKPDYVPILDWFGAADAMTSSAATTAYSTDLAAAGDEAELLFARAAGEVIGDQIACGIDVPTDGEVRRENYIHYHCRHLAGFDFENLTQKSLRDDAYVTELPTIRGPVTAKSGHFLTHDYQVAQAFTKRPIKVTLPGPLTIADTTYDDYYGDQARLCADLADALNYEIRALAAAGCRYIQIDEPLFARKVAEALDFGIDMLSRCFAGVPDNVTRAMHMCCGYPNQLDDEGYHKADRGSYLRLADAVNGAAIDQVSIEDAHQPNDLSLLERFDRIDVIFGAVAIARSEVESEKAIRERLIAALNHIDRDRLIAAPDCGLGLLGRDLAMKKLRVLTSAAQSV